jgi:hypothetical protein
MPIWLHLILAMLCTIVGFFGGAAIGMGASMIVLQALRSLEIDRTAVLLLVAMPLFFGGGLVGLCLGRAFAVNYLPARCPKCGGRTYYQPGEPITYHCRSCQHIHKTPVTGG